VSPIGSIFSQDAALIKDAQVKIKSQNGMLDFKFNAANRRYEADNLKSNFIKANQKYELEVRTSDGKMIAGQCQVPENYPVMENIQILESAPTDLTFLINWLPASIGSHIYFNHSIVFDRILRIGIPNTYLKINEFNLYPLEVTAKSKYLTSGTVENFKELQKCTLNIRCINMSQEMAKYLKSYYSNQNWSSNSERGFGFLPEPAPIFGNLVGGVGIFGAYNQNLKQIILK
jgi:hypothetical protein